MLKNFSNYDKVKLVQSICLAVTILTVTLNFNLVLLLLGLAVSWLFYCFGLAITLHKYASHRTFEPKNKLIKYFLLWTGTVITMGTSLEFAAGHRTHHKFSDTSEDPYNLDGGLWHRIKLFFYWFPTWKINPLIIRDLIRDKDQQFFSNHYWKILLPYPIILLLIDPILFGYFYAMPVTYVLLGMGYVTVIAHLPSLQKNGATPFDTNDLSWNNKFIGWVLAGEGYHNTHHAFPGSYTYEKVPGDVDLSGKIIKLLGKIPD